MAMTYDQLSFDVRPHPELVGQPILGGSLRVSGSYGVQADLNAGQELTVTIANADGEVIAQGVAEVASVAFEPVKVKGEVLGTERAHRAKLTR